MKKVVLTFGVLSGLLPVVVMVLGMLFGSGHGNGAFILGWTVIILSSLIYLFWSKKLSRKL